MSFVKAVRKAAPVMVELSGVSGGGKTTTALLIAAGMAGPDGVVALLDTENGRGSLLADEPIIQKALPNGYLYDELTAPFTPERYVEKVQEAERNGVMVLCVDSTSHEFEGVGGVSDIAENSKMGWAPAKIRHRKFLAHVLSSSMDFVFCFRARPKVKIVGKDVIDLGILPASEKNWAFDMTFRWHMEDKTHNATLLKAPRSLEDRGLTGRLLTKADGEMIRVWKLGGTALSPDEQLKKRARSAADEGLAKYQSFFTSLNPTQKKALAVIHPELKSIAERADRESVPEFDDFTSAPDAMEIEPGSQIKVGGKLYAPNADQSAFVQVGA